MASGKTSASLKWALRIYSALAGILGVGFIIWACVIQNPPKNALPVGLIILGSFSLAMCIFGLFHSCCTRCCLSVFLLVASLVTVAQLGLVITLFANLDGTVNNLVNAESNGTPSPPPKKDRSPPPPPTTRRLLQDTANADEIKSHLEIGRWVFLVFVLIEFVALIVTIVVRIRNPYEADADSFEEQQAARSAMAQIQMEGLKHSMQRTASKSPAVGANDGNFYTVSNKLYKSVTKKMTMKYGEFTQDPAFQSGGKWWQKMPWQK